MLRCPRAPTKVPSEPSPANLVERREQARTIIRLIADLDDDRTRLSSTEEVAGSRFYCAPELRDGRLKAGIPSEAADVYSLGKVLYWMLSVGRTFDREEHRQECYQLGQHDPGNPAYELANHLLDTTIVQDWRNRTLGAQQLLANVDHYRSA